MPSTAADEFKSAYAQAEARRENVRQEVEDQAPFETRVGHALALLGELNGPTVAVLTFDRTPTHNLIVLINDCLRAAAKIIEAAAALNPGVEDDLRTRTSADYEKWRGTHHEPWRNAGYAVMDLGRALMRTNDDTDSKVNDLARALSHCLITAVDLAAKERAHLSTPGA